MPKAVASTSFASTSYALDSSEEQFCSSSNEEELSLDWLTHSMKDFAVFVAKNQEFLRTSGQKVKSLDSNSSIEKVTEVSKRVHKHLNKCISALTLHKEQFKREYSEWCNKFIDKHSDAESEENVDENQAKASKDDRKKAKKEEEGEDSKTKAESSKVKSSKKNEEGEESGTEAKSKGKKSSKKKDSDDEKQEDSRTEANSSGKKSSKNKGKEDEWEKSRTEEKSSGKESNKKKKKRIRDSNENNVDEPKEQEIIQSSPTSPAESEHEIEIADGQVVLESDDGDHYFNTNTLLMETPHSNDEADESSITEKSPKDKAQKSNVNVDANSTSDIFASSMEADEIDEAPRLPEKTSSGANMSKSGNSKNGKSLVPRKFSGKRPGPASKTGGSVASPAMPEDSNSDEKKQEATSVADSQATQFSDEDDELKMREDQALLDLLQSSEESDDEELFKKPVKPKKSKKSKRKVTELFVASNMDEFAHIAQLYQTCVVKLTRCDKTGKLKKRSKNSRRDTDADIDK
jgi:hypothetical protein